MVVFPPFGVGEEDGLGIRGVDAKGRLNGNMEQLLRTLRGLASSLWFPSLPYLSNL